MKNFIAEVGNPTPKSVIEDLEKKYNIKLPKELRKYYLKYGNSELKSCRFKIEDFSFEVRQIVSLDCNDKLPFDKIIYYDRLEEWIPKTFYPLAYDSGGNYYYWDSTNGHIYMVYNDDVDYPCEICKSVKEFFKLLEKSEKVL